MENKKYYWIKLRTNFFNREDIDFILSQDNGCQYVVLYQMLCLNTANTNGRFENQMNEVIVPYDIKKIIRDCKYFDFDTVIVALDLFKKLGLIYEQEDGILKITNIEEMVGSESANKEAIKKREYRMKKKIMDSEMDKIGTNCPTEYRDKSIEYRDIDIKKENIKRKSFIKPTIEEIEKYCKERNNGINAEAFYNFYESKDWYVGKNRMKDWKACIRTWEQRTPKANEPKWIDKEIDQLKATDNEIQEIDDLFKEIIEK